MIIFARWIQFLLVMLLLAAAVVPVSAGSDAGYQTGFAVWRAAEGGFNSWTLAGAALAPGADRPGLVLDPASATPGTDPYPAGGYYGVNYYNGGQFLVGEATSPVMPVDFAFEEAIASWNAFTPEGTWIETQIRARLGTRWTKWYNLGIWAENDGAVQRHWVRLQGDTDGYVSVDTLVLSKGKLPADALQVKVRLFQAAGASALPVVHNVSLAYSQAAPKKIKQTSSGDPAYWGTVLDVPTCSQMVYVDGGNVWCSPTSTSMVLGYWGYLPGECAPRVRSAVSGTYDWVYLGYGNWPFNTAYAASQNVYTGLGSQPMEAYVARYTSLAALEPWIAAGVPVVMSIAWKKSDLTDAPISASSGHLMVLVGFDNQGNAVVNDPAASSDAGVRRTYLRSELETIWQTASGGTVYLIYPEGHTVPGIER